MLSALHWESPEMFLRMFEWYGPRRSAGWIRPVLSYNPSLSHRCHI